MSGRPDGAAQHGFPRCQDLSVAQPPTGPCQQRAGPVQALRLVLEEPRQVLGGAGVEWSQAQVLADLPLMLRNRLPSFGIVPDRIRIGTQLQGGEPQNVGFDLQRLLLRKASEYGSVTAEC